MLVANLLVGVAMLLFGRRLFWVFVAGTGFAVAAVATVDWFHQRSDAVAITAAVVAGLVGALIAVYAQKMAVGIAGALAGGYLGYLVGTTFELPVSPWIVAAVGGVLGSLVLAALFDWALIALSAMVGAAVIAQAAPVERPWPSVIFVLLIGTGLAIQARQHVKKPAKSP